MAIKIPTTFVASIVQGSADAYIEGEIVTGLQAIGSLAYRLLKCTIGWPTLPIGAATSQEFQISRTSKAAIAEVNDRDIILSRRRDIKMTTSGAVLNDKRVEEITFPVSDESGIIIVEDPIYIAFDSGSTSLTSTLYFQMVVEQIKISEVDRLTLLARNNL